MYRFNGFAVRGRGSIDFKSIVVIVGPNNAGKSQLLKDITLCASGQVQEAKILESVDIDLGGTAIEFATACAGRLQSSNDGRHFLNGAGISLDDNASIQYDVRQLQYHIASEEAARQHIATAFARGLLAYLTTEARLTFSKHRTNLYRPNSPGASSLVEALFDSSPEDEEWLSTRTKRAFDLAVALDSFSSAGSLEIRVATSFTGLDRSDRSSARTFLQSCERLDQQGDGLRSFTATLGAVRSLHREIFLIDEPEAFLHPPQAYQMGRAVAQAGGKQIICATHSADFLRGVISGSDDVTVIRISRSRQGQSIQSLSPDDLKVISSDRLLSSQRVLDGIFYRNAIITESDGDAVLYEGLFSEINPSGETFYVNSYSKQATTAITAPYKKMGVPHAAIIDLDLIRVGPEFLKVAQVFLPDPGEVCELADSVRIFIEELPVGDLVTASFQRLSKLPTEMSESC